MIGKVFVRRISLNCSTTDADTSFGSTEAEVYYDVSDIVLDCGLIYEDDVIPYASHQEAVVVFAL